MSDDNGELTPTEQLADQVAALKTQMDTLTAQLADETAGAREATRLMAAIVTQALLMAEHATQQLVLSQQVVGFARPVRTSCGGTDAPPTPSKG